MKKKNSSNLHKKRFILGILGLLMGLTNGFFGSGGGMIAVESMERSGIDSKRAHASSILAILPLSIVSAAVYFFRGNIDFGRESLFLLGGASAGGILGAILLGKLSARWIDKLFTALMLIAGARMVFS